MAALATGAEAYLLKANATSELLPVVEAALRNVTNAEEPVPNLP
jgi:DNA-binding response OmpR family regulator